MGFEVTYFTSGLSWSADYVLVAAADETQLSFDGFVTIANHSGEDYDNAEVRLVVGVVNLVEKIRDLAQRGMITGAELEGALKDKSEARRQVLRKAVEQAEFKADGALFGVGGGGAAPPEVVKEGLSEYFIYSVGGRQTVPDGWSRRLASFTARQVSFDIVYRMRDWQYGPRPVRFFIVKNDAEHKLGTTPLPDGLVRTFRDNGRDGLAFLGQQQVTYVPIKADMELNLGTDDQVIYETKTLSVARASFHFTPAAGSTAGTRRASSARRCGTSARSPSASRCAACSAGISR